MGIFSRTRKIRMSVEGMTCGHCVKKVTEALTSLDEVKKAAVSLESKSAEVVLKKEDAELQKLVAAVKNLGYEAEIIE